MDKYFPVCVLCGNTLKRVEIDGQIEWHANRTPARECPNGAGYHSPEIKGGLNSIMEFDCPIQVHSDGAVSQALELQAPELYMSVDGDGQSIYADDSDIKDAAKSAGWELLTGYTGQYSYNGPVMHPSEFVGGGLEFHILETPGYYVVVTVECMGPEGTEDDDLEPAGWAIAYRETAGAGND